MLAGGVACSVIVGYVECGLFVPGGAEVGSVAYVGGNLISMEILGRK